MTVLELETDRAALDAKQQEKLRELEAVARSRSKSRQRDYTEQEEDDGDLVQNSYLQEKREREQELVQLAARNTSLAWQPDTREVTSTREERNRELAEVAAREKLAVAQYENSQSSQPPSELSDLELSQQIWAERAEELRQISQLTQVRSKSRQDCSSPGPGKVRTTAAAWRDRGGSQSPAVPAVPAVPTRRIGSLFNRDPDYWNLNDSSEELPEPPRSPPCPQSPPAPTRQSSG